MKTIIEDHHRVNWVDGMKINRGHFIGLENSMLKSINDVSAVMVSPIAYGLLPEIPENNTSLDLSISIDGHNTIDIEVHSCHAITPGGFPIHITSELSALMEQSSHSLKKRYTVKDGEQEWSVILGVNPYRTLEAGVPDIKEEPPRRPYAIPRYSLEVVSNLQANNREMGYAYLTIAKIFDQNGKITADTGFIPACKSVQSHPVLRYSHSELVHFLNHMERSSTHIIQKIYQKKQSNDLAKIALSVSHSVLTFLNENINPFMGISKYDAPIHMITTLMNLARVLKSGLDIFVGSGKENFLNYLTNWCDLNQGEFESVLMELISIEYKHADINTAMTKIASFTKLMLPLFKKLSELDYIGKKDDSGIFVKEEVVKEEPKGRRSFLFD